MIKTVQELRKALSPFKPDTEVGVAMSSIIGWVQGIRRITKDNKGRVIIDQCEETLDKEEVNIG